MFYQLSRIAMRRSSGPTTVITLLAVVLACGAGQEQQEQDTSEPKLGRTRLTVEELPPMPPYPPARRGRLVAQSAGDHDITGSWRTTAGLCDQEGTLEIYAGPQGFSTALLLYLPEEDRVGEYPVVAASAAPPDAPAALIAVQAFADPDAYGFQAYHGLLELTEFGEKVSGRFTSTLREISTDILTHYVGVFQGISLEPLPADYCRVLEDSAAVVDSTAGDG
jgi:hypothetical protein